MQPAISGARRLGGLRHVIVLKQRTGSRAGLRELLKFIQLSPRGLTRHDVFWWADRFLAVALQGQPADLSQAESRGRS
ncbi:MAG TPA: hypothetical protein VLQ45_24160 [Thermoanaerobaculia bacterium]|nr:hypothetical protein [Thermoanaerobaculia bacterium]